MEYEPVAQFYEQNFSINLINPFQLIGLKVM